MAYATPTDFLNRVDSRRLGDLGLDDGTRVSASNLLTNTRLQAALDDAAGVIDAHLLKGGRYQITDLTTLSSTTSYGNNLLIRLNVRLAYGNLLEARDIQPPRSYDEALAELDKLADGQWIFGIAPVVAAGRTVSQQLDTQLTLLTGASTRYFGQLDYQQTGSNVTPPLTSNS